MGIGIRLEKIMKEKGINANELSIKIGVTPSTLYSMIKRDSNRVDIDLIIKIARALNITADELLSDEHIKSPHTLAAHFEGEEFTPEEQEEIDNFVKFVKSKRS
jgi:transcriptional regulator with XRE-family HTH domain